jgi:hypothetical protein
LDGSGRHVIYVLEGLRKTMTDSGQDSPCSGRDSNRAPPEYKSKALRLHQPVRYGIHNIPHKTVINSKMAAGNSTARMSLEAVVANFTYPPSTWKLGLCVHRLLPREHWNSEFESQAGNGYMSISSVQLETLR